MALSAWHFSLPAAEAQGLVALSLDATHHALALVQLQLVLPAFTGPHIAAEQSSERSSELDRPGAANSRSWSSSRSWTGCRVRTDSPDAERNSRFVAFRIDDTERNKSAPN